MNEKQNKADIGEKLLVQKRRAVFAGVKMLRHSLSVIEQDTATIGYYDFAQVPRSAFEEVCQFHRRALGLFATSYCGYYTLGSTTDRFLKCNEKLADFADEIMELMSKFGIGTEPIAKCDINFLAALVRNALSQIRDIEKVYVEAEKEDNNFYGRAAYRMF